MSNEFTMKASHAIGERMIVQISTVLLHGSTGVGNSSCRVYALCNDGTIWVLRDDGTIGKDNQTQWRELREIPKNQD